MSELYDILVIGAGAGTKLVTPPSLIGKKVAVFERESPGGTCLNRGCIPSKMVIYPSELLRIPDLAKRFGFDFSVAPNIDQMGIFERVNSTVKKDSDSIPIAYEKNPNITYIPKEVYFLDDQTVSDGSKEYKAKNIIIATGTRPKLPEITGLKDTPYWTSREALQPPKFPKSMIVIGAGFIGLELGAAYQALGCDVTGLTRTEILRGIDSEIRAEFESHPPFPIHDHFTIEKVEYRENQFFLSGVDKFGAKHALYAESLLVATGITPNTEALKLFNTNIKTNSLGFIQVNEYLETNVPNIYAFGDVIGKFFFRHSANFEGEYLFDQLFVNETRRPIEYPPMPSAIFTHPQIATVGATEAELIKNKISYWKGINPYSSSAMGMARLSDSGFVKILVCKKTETVLGAHIIGDEASNMIHQIILGMTMKLKLDDYLRMIYIHPAISEIVRNAFRKVKQIKLSEGKV